MDRRDARGDWPVFTCTGQQWKQSSRQSHRNLLRIPDQEIQVELQAIFTAIAIIRP